MEKEREEEISGSRTRMFTHLGGALVTWLTALVSGVLPGLVCIACPYIANSSFCLASRCVRGLLGHSGVCLTHSATHPNILYAVITLAQFTKNPLATHRTAIKHIFRYLKGTMNHVLTYGGDGKDWVSKITQYVDADGGTNPH
jgi:hypothetical protein